MIKLYQLRTINTTEQSRAWRLLFWRLPCSVRTPTPAVFLPARIIFLLKWWWSQCNWRFLFQIPFLWRFIILCWFLKVKFDILPALLKVRMQVAEAWNYSLCWKRIFIKGKQCYFFCGEQCLMTDASATKNLHFPGLLEILAYCSWPWWSL